MLVGGSGKGSVSWWQLEGQWRPSSKTDSCTWGKFRLRCLEATCCRFRHRERRGPTACTPCLPLSSDTTFLLKLLLHCLSNGQVICEWLQALFKIPQTGSSELLYNERRKLRYPEVKWIQVIGWTMENTNASESLLFSLNDLFQNRHLNSLLWSLLKLN